jgi:hypothetical protein
MVIAVSWPLQWVANHPQQNLEVAAPPLEYLVMDLRGTPRVVRPTPMNLGVALANRGAYRGWPSHLWLASELCNL